MELCSPHQAVTGCNSLLRGAQGWGVPWYASETVSPPRQTPHRVHCIPTRCPLAACCTTCGFRARVLKNFAHIMQASEAKASMALEKEERRKDGNPLRNAFFTKLLHPIKRAALCTARVGFCRSRNRSHTDRGSCCAASAVPARMPGVLTSQAMRETEGTANTFRTVSDRPSSKKQKR